MQETSLASRPIQSLRCPTLHFLTSYLLSDTDLIGLGCWDAEMHRGLTPTAWCRSLLHVALQCRDDAATRVTDLLDVRHMDEIAQVRSSDTDALEHLASAATVSGRAARGLVWALITDERDDVHALGQRLITELYVRACRDYGA